MDNEEKLIQASQAAVGEGDEIVAAGWFEPWSRVYMNIGVGGMGSGGGTGSLLLDGALGGVSAAAAAGEVEQSGNMPAAVILAVGKTHVYAFEGNMAVPTGKVGELWRSWSLSEINVHAHKTLYIVSVTIEETGEGGHRYNLVGSKLHLSSSKAVMNALLDT